jgi:hypothetical protein
VEIESIKDYCESLIAEIQRIEISSYYLKSKYEEYEENYRLMFNNKSENM